MIYSVDTAKLSPEWISALGALVSALFAGTAVVASIIIHCKTRNLLKPTERPILALRKDEPTHKEIPAENKLLINLHLQFVNIGKNPAESVRFRSYFGPLSDPDQLESGLDLESANTVYPENEFNPWEQIRVEDKASSDMSKIRALTLFYYCRLDYRDAFDQTRSHTQDFYCIYNIARKRLQHATSEQKRQFQQRVHELIPPTSN